MGGVLDGVDLRTQLAGQNRFELLLFRLATRQRFGINVFKVQEVIQCPCLTQVPGSHPVVRGIANMRGKTIPVMDLSAAIGETSMGGTDGRFVIITEYNRKTQGFLVGSVDRIVNTNWESVLPPPKGIADASYMTAVTQVDDELIEIIDVEKVLTEVVGDAQHVCKELSERTASADGGHVLVADDSMVARKQVKRVLDAIGIACTLKNDGQEALDQLQQWAENGSPVSDQVALIISDIEMPKMDGYSLTAAIRQDPRLQDLHILLHSSLSGVFNESMVKKVGADRFLAKFDPDELAKIVQKRLHEHVVAHCPAGN